MSEGVLLWQEDDVDQTRSTNPKKKAGIMKQFKVDLCVSFGWYRNVRVSTLTLKIDYYSPVRRASEGGVPSPVLVHARCRPARLSINHQHSRASVAWPRRAPSRQRKRTGPPRRARRAYSGRSTYRVIAGFPCPRRRIRMACSCEGHRDSYPFHAEGRVLNERVVGPPDQRARGRRDLRIPLKAAPRTSLYQ